MGVLRGKWRAVAAVLGFLLASGLIWGAGRILPRQISICELQGTGRVSAFQDREVRTRGLVSLTVLTEREIALLDVSCPESGQGSRGLLISLGQEVYPLQVGDEIEVRGTVREVGGETRLEVESQGLKILSLDNQLPEPAVLSSYLEEFPSLLFEDWEGQLVRIPRAVVQTESGLDGELTVIPDLTPDPSLGILCFQTGSIQFRLLLEDGDPVALLREDGSLLEDLVGLLREDQDGYYLQLLEEPFHSLRYGRQQDQETAAGTQPSGTDVGGDFQDASQTSTLGASSTTAWTTTSTIIPSPTFYPIPLLISEFLPNPAGEEPGGEWFEIYNPGGKKLPLDGIKLGDEMSPSGKEGLLRFPDGYHIGGGELLVIANQARVFSALYGFRPDFELTDSDPHVPDLLAYPEWGRTAVQLSNSGDEVLLVSPWDQILDLVAYGDGDSMVKAPKEGHSLERYPPDQDSDLPGDWRESYPPSPGSLNWTTSSETSAPVPSLSATGLESSQTPGGVPEVTTSGTVSLPIPSLTLTGTPLVIPTSSPSCSPSATWTVTGTATLTLTESVVPSPSQTATILSQSTSTSSALSPTPPVSSTSGLPVESCTATLVPSLTQEVSSSPTPAVLLPTPSTGPLPTVTAVPAGTPSVTPSGTPEPVPTSSATSSATSIALPTVVPSITSTVTDEPFPALQINEIHADPDPVFGDSNGDGQVSATEDEFLELVNLSGVDLDLEGWEIYDAVRLRYSFPSGTMLKAGCGLVVFGGGSPTGDFGGSLVFSAGSLGLNNTGDSLFIKNPQGELVSSCSYGEEGGQDQSLNRDPDLVGDLPLVLHSLIPGADGALFSPGFRADGTPFGVCP